MSLDYEIEVRCSCDSVEMPDDGGKFVISKETGCLDLLNDAQTGDNQLYNLKRILPVLETDLQQDNTKTSRAYRYALKSFTKAVEESEKEDDVAAKWIGAMVAGNLKLTTARYYVENVRAMLHRHGCGAYVADELLDRMAGYVADTGMELPNQAKVLSMMTRIASAPDVDVKYRKWFDILLVSVLGGGLRVEDVVRMRKDCLPPVPMSAKGIIERNVSSRRKFVFQMEQGRRTDARIAADVKSKLSMLLTKMYGAPLMYDDDMAVLLWISLALEAGVGPENVVGIVGRMPAVNHSIRLVERVESDERRRIEIMDIVADRVVRPTRSQWHAMKLRHGVSPDDIETAVGNMPGISMPQTFYPMAKVARKKGGNIKYEMKPLLPDVLFFKATEGQIEPLLAAIGEMAWVYRQTASVDSPVAVIPTNDMVAFQRMVSVFTPDMVVGMAQPELTAGQRVVVTGGALAGLEATVRRSLSRAAAADEQIEATFSLEITNTVGIHWTATLPASCLAPLEN